MQSNRGSLLTIFPLLYRETTAKVGSTRVYNHNRPAGIMVPGYHRYAKVPEHLSDMDADADESMASETDTILSDPFDSELFVEEFDKIFSAKFERAFTRAYRESLNKAYKNASKNAYDRPAASKSPSDEFFLAYGMSAGLAIGLRVTQAVFGIICLGMSAAGESPLVEVAGSAARPPGCTGADSL